MSVRRAGWFVAQRQRRGTAGASWFQRRGTTRSQGGVDRFRINDVGLSSLSARRGGLDESQEERVRSIGPRLELGVRLRADVERVIGDLGELDESAVGRGARAAHARGLELRAVARVELVTVAVTFRDDGRTVKLGDDRSLVE